MKRPPELSFTAAMALTYRLQNKKNGTVSEIGPADHVFDPIEDNGPHGIEKDLLSVGVKLPGRKSGHVLGDGPFLGEGPGEHKLGLEDRSATLDDAVKGRRHPAYQWMDGAPLSVLHALAGVQLEPMAIELLGGDAELDDEVGREVLRLDLAAFLLPEPDKRGFIVAHDDSRVSAANKPPAAVREQCTDVCIMSHLLLQRAVIDTFSLN
jgi:hypothetical protein